MMDIEKYAHMWRKPFHHVLGPLPPDLQGVADYPYYPYSFKGVHYTLYVIPRKYLPAVVARMIEEGVPVRDPLPVETQEEALAHFWTDRLHEFALFPNPSYAAVTHTIYQLFDEPEIIFVPIYISKYQRIVDNMLAAGARILTEDPPSLFDEWRDSNDSNKG